MKKIYLSLLTIAAGFMTTAQVPTVVADFNPGTANFSPNNLTVFNNSLYFGGDDSSGTSTGGVDQGRELWISDGTAAGTSLLLDINPGSSGSSPFNFFEFNNNLYFTGNDGAAELWTTDGTAVGTTKVDLFPAIVGDVPNNAVVLGSSVYLTTNQNGTNNQLTEWDGTNAAAIAADAVNASATTFVSDMTTWNGLIYAYMDYSPDEPTLGRELYTYNPATDTYTLILDIATGTGNSGISNFTSTATKLYFEAQGDLWETDGTTAGTQQVPAAATLGMNGVNNLFAFNNEILFEGDNGAGDQLWSLDTTTGVITQLSNNSGSNSNHDPSDYVIYGGEVYYRGEDSNDTDGHLFKYDGTSISQQDNTIKDLDDLVVFNNKIYFEGDQDGVTGNELFVFDPNTATIETVINTTASIYPNPNNGSFTIDTETNVDQYRIYDLSGRVVETGVVTNNRIDSNLNTGVYLLELTGETAIQNIKFIVE